MATEVTDTDIATAALNPKRIKGDQGEVEEHPIADVIAAQDRLANATAAARNHGGMVFTRLTPGGTT